MEANVFLWLGPTLGAMFAWGIAQGLVKKYVGEVPPARFCLYYAVANGLVSLSFWYASDTPDVLAAENREFLIFGLLAYLLDGVAWIFYYQSIVHGPISIVGTLSAAYPAITVLLARFLLSEQLSAPQYVGVGAVIGGCLALAYTPPDPEEKSTQNRWMGFAGAALLIWGVNGILIKHSYSLPGADEGNMALFIAVGGILTLGVYGFLFGRQGASERKEWVRSFLPMGMMALGGLMAAIAYKKGPASIVSPLSGAYPVVTLTFALMILKERPTRLHWAGIVAILCGMALSTLSEVPPVEHSVAAASLSSTDAEHLFVALSPEASYRAIDISPRGCPGSLARGSPHASPRRITMPHRAVDGCGSGLAYRGESLELGSGSSTVSSGRGPIECYQVYRGVIRSSSGVCADRCQPLVAFVG